MFLATIPWATVGIKAAQLILSLSILVILHEFGHYITAKIFKCRVEKFYLFFDAWFSIVKKKVGETEYGIGWIPLGGYVKITGMIDESMDKEQMKLPPQPYEFRSKPAWQRLIIMLAGITMNILLGFTIYSMMLWHWGDTYTPAQKLPYGIYADSLAQKVGLQSGDIITAIDGKPTTRFEEIPLDILLNNVKTITVNRGGNAVNISLPSDLASQVINKKLHFLTATDIRIPIQTLDSIVDTSAAKKAGFLKNDLVIGVNNQPVKFWDEFSSAIKSNINKPVAVQVLRNQKDTVILNVTVPESGTIGVSYSTKDLDKIIPTDTIRYSFFGAIPAGISKGCGTLVSYVRQLRILFGGKINVAQNVGGPVSIANLFPAMWDWQSFWSLTAFLSMMLAIMNLLPIPGLDGGHALFCIYEIITRRKPSDKFMEYAQVAGMIILFGLMIFAFGNDIFKLFKK
ncbi:RIP metalloprotease RseP [Arachidicoccus ginsenosidimutans]|uniref:RIP metalloprotease RseP n=1 Tax=Arachidicoccus sp. BS20 TaxID=1850526 RepID=UPI0007F116B7|nr:RIP metalloprotease RseP [Arachidicoccus sp. BS20]ANI90025.1 RIP metalloprotease RseP [Arachidicoccus sp. BS20]